MVKEFVLWSFLHVRFFARRVNLSKSSDSVDNKEIGSVSELWSVLLLAPELILGLVLPQAVVEVVPASGLGKERPRIVGQGMEFESIQDRDGYLVIVSIDGDNFRRSNSHITRCTTK